MIQAGSPKPRYVVCIHNKGYAGSLELRKLYRRLPDPDADQIGMIRILDEEGEDYLYPADWFVLADLPAEAVQAIETAVDRNDFSRYFANVPQTAEEQQELIKEFDQAMMDIYRRAKSEAGYVATRYLDMLHEHGGLKTARMLLEAKDPSEGYTALWERGRLDLTVEALVFGCVKFQSLFTSDEHKKARERLSQYQYQPALAHA